MGKVIHCNPVYNQGKALAILADFGMSGNSKVCLYFFNLFFKLHTTVREKVPSSESAQEN